VRNQGNLVKIPAKNDNLIIQNYINKSFNTLNSLRSLNNSNKLTKKKIYKKKKKKKKNIF